MIVDCHAHLVPPDLLAAIRKDAAKFPSARQIEDGGSLALAFAGGKPTRPVSKPLSDIPARLAWMAKNGIDRQVVGGWVDMFGYELPGAEAESLGSARQRLPARRRQDRAAFRAAGDRAARRRRARRRGAERRGESGLCRLHDRHAATRRRLDARRRRSRSVLAGGRRDRRADPYPSELRRRRRARERFRPRQWARPHHRCRSGGGAADLGRPFREVQKREILRAHGRGRPALRSRAASSAMPRSRPISAIRSRRWPRFTPTPSCTTRAC